MYYWKELNSSQLESTYKYLETLKPFGMGNPKPNIILRNQTISDYRIVGKNKNVLSIQLESGIKCVKFKYSDDYDIKIGDTVDILGKINKNEWQNKISYDIFIEDIKNKEESYARN